MSVFTWQKPDLTAYREPRLPLEPYVQGAIQVEADGALTLWPDDTHYWGVIPAGKAVELAYAILARAKDAKNLTPSTDPT
jgi:hypothetical protein